MLATTPASEIAEWAAELRLRAEDEKEAFAEAQREAQLEGGGLQ